MAYLMEGCPSAIYLFTFSVSAKTLKHGIKKVLPLVKRCEDFAEALHIHSHADTFSPPIDGIFTIRLVFNIKEPQESILLKVPALFSFAASGKIDLLIQFFYP